MNPEQVKIFKAALARSYDQGCDDGYKRAHRESYHLLSALCNREDDGMLSVMDSELCHSRALEIETGRLPASGPGGYYFRVKK